MNLVIFTPVIKQSAIARMSALVYQALIDLGHHVHVIRTENQVFHDEETHEFRGAAVLSWEKRNAVRKAVRCSDLCIYHIGNNYYFHQGALHWIVIESGIVCLHDLFLGNLFWEWSYERRDSANKVLREWYGDDISQSFFSHSNVVDFINATKDSAPLTEWMCAMALGVIVHSNFGVDRVLSSCTGPVRTVPLAYNALNNSSVFNQIDKEILQVITVGHINPNKRVDVVIKAISNSNILKQKLTYTLVGSIEDDTAESLLNLAKNLGVKLIIFGQVSEKHLSECFQQADMVCCLRWPCLESASASAIEAMLHAKPVIVTDAGFYSELPDSCVFKVSLENEITDLQFVLERLVSDADIRVEVGQQARVWAQKTFTAMNYAEQLIQMVEQVSKARPVLQAIDFFNDLMDHWSVNQEQLDLEYVVKPLSIFENKCKDLD